MWARRSVWRNPFQSRSSYPSSWWLYYPPTTFLILWQFSNKEIWLASLTCHSEVVVPWQQNGTTKGKQSFFHYVFFGCFFTDIMDELKKLLCSQHSHKSHLSKVLSNVEEILQKLSYTKESEPNSTLTSSKAVLLAEHQKQLRQKADIFNELDEKIIMNRNSGS